MRIDSWHDVMNQTVVWEKRSGLDAYGDPVFLAPVDVRARVTSRNRVTRTVGGQEQVSTVTVYLGEVVGVSVLDRITLPSPFSPAQPQILEVRTIPDDDGNIHHEEIMT